MEKLQDIVGVLLVLGLLLLIRRVLFPERPTKNGRTRSIPRKAPKSRTN